MNLIIVGVPDYLKSDEARRTYPRQSGVSPVYTNDVLLTLGIHRKAMKGNGKTVTLHGISSEATLQQLKNQTRERHNCAVLRAGMPWLEKGSKECFELSNEDDFSNAKREYTVESTGEVKDLRIAVHVIDSQHKVPGINSESGQVSSRKARTAKRLKMSSESSVESYDSDDLEEANFKKFMLEDDQTSGKKETFNSS